MKKFLSVILILVALFLLSGCGVRDYDSEEVKKAGKLVVGVTEFAPMNYKENGEWTGFDTEFARLFAKEKLGVEVEFVEIIWDSKFDVLNDYSVDCIWNGLTFSEQVQGSAAISNSYLRNSQVLVAKADRIANYKDGYEIKDCTFVVEKGSAAQECLERSGYKNIEKVETQIQAVECVSSGSKDIAVVDVTLANALVGEGKTYSDLKKGFDFSQETYVVAFRKDSDLPKMLNNYIDEIRDEELLELANKYGLTLS